MASTNTELVSRIASDAIDDQILEQWRKFFKITTNQPDGKKRLYAISKLTQIALVQYLKMRKVYDDEVFVKRNYQGFKFYTLNQKNEFGAKLNEVLVIAGNFTTLSTLKALRFQIFPDPEKPTEIGEEILFQYYYGDDLKVTIQFGLGDSIEIDMEDCSFENFLRSFGEIIGTIRAHCTHLQPLPSNAEKRIRTSLFRRLPPGFEAGPLNTITSQIQYAPGIQSRPIGDARLSGVVVAALLRTCFLTPEIEDNINESSAQMVPSATNDIFGQGERVESARHTQPAHETSPHHQPDHSPANSIIPIGDVSVASVSEMTQPEAEHAPTDTANPIIEVPMVTRTSQVPRQSPSYSIVSMDVLLPGQQATAHVDGSDSRDGSKSGDGDHPSNKDSERNAPSGNNSLEKDPDVGRRKTASKRKSSNAKSAMKTRSATKRPRST